jgi:hypothetical protein
VIAGRLNKGFRGSFPAIFTIYLLIAFLSLFISSASENYYYPNIFYNFLSGLIQSDWMILILNHLLLIGGLSLTGYIISNEEITEKQNYFPAFIFLLINAMVIGKDRLSLFMLSNLVMLYAIFQIFRIYRRENVLGFIFTSCFWISVSIYLNVVNVFFIPFIFISLFILRPFYWRELANAALGFITPVIIYECVSYLFNFNQWYVFESIAELFSNFKIPLLNIHYLPFLVVSSLILIFSFLYFIANGLGNTVKKQKAKSCFFWFILLVSPAIFTAGVNYSNVLVLISIPVSFLVGEFLFQIKSLKLSNFFLLLLMVASFYFMIHKSFFQD